MWWTDLSLLPDLRHLPLQGRHLGGEALGEATAGSQLPENKNTLLADYSFIVFLLAYDII